MDAARKKKTKPTFFVPFFFFVPAGKTPNGKPLRETTAAVAAATGVSGPAAARPLPLSYNAAATTTAIPAAVPVAWRQQR